MASYIDDEGNVWTDEYSSNGHFYKYIDEHYRRDQVFQWTPLKAFIAWILFVMLCGFLGKTFYPNYYPKQYPNTPSDNPKIENPIKQYDYRLD